MSIRSDALRWLASRYGVRGGAIYTSKFFGPGESWTGRRAWWLQIPVNRIQGSIDTDIHLVCQIAPNKIAFHYLKVPAAYFREQLPKLIVLDNGKVNLFLSAEPKNMFVDERGNGRVSFSRFLRS